MLILNLMNQIFWELLHLKLDLFPTQVILMTF